MIRATCLTALLAGAALITPAAPATAATLTVGSVGGTWGDVVDSGETRGGLAGRGTSSINWGTSAVAGEARSGYRFAGGAPVTSTASDLFALGRYTHHNGTIWSNSTDLKRADLALSVGGTANGQAFSTKAAFRFTHDESLNSGNPCSSGGSGPCADGVGISLLSGLPLVFTVGKDTFTLLIEGFVEQLGGPLVTSFVTEELEEHSLFLQARLTVTTDTSQEPDPPAPVPLPASLPLLLAGLGAVGLAARRRKA